jgi:sugar lactone lactonase YvrE
MPFVVKDRVQVTSTTTGTGAFTLGAAVDGFQDFGAISPTAAAWDISKASYSYQSFSVVAQETVPNGITFKPDGTKMYIVGATGDDVNEYNLSIAWDITTASYLQNFSVAAQEIVPEGLFFKPDGTKMYIVGSDTDSVYEYDLSTAWDISSASYLQAFSVAAQDTSPQGLFFKPDGTKMYIVGNTGDDINEYDLSTPWDISTASFLQNFSVNAQDATPTNIFFKPDGTKMYVTGIANDAVYEYSLSSAWNISTASYVQSFSLIAQGDNPEAIFFKPDGSQFWTVSTATDAVFSYYIGPVETYYAITDGTDWEVGIGTVVAGIDLVRNTVLESSNSNALVNWGAGTKYVLCTFPADATEGTVPQGDTSQVGTDLVAWTNLKKELDRTVINGVPYNNNNTAGVGSTFSLVNTAWSGDGYNGGVLAPNGDIHFVKHAATTGQKINYLTGVVSTYGLINTLAAQAYFGGVLAPNGDIHFVPYTATRGLKINSSGVVSTYSLVYTVGGGAYSGGVLAPNGDIYFVPWQAPIGQKVSAAGVVSTYSLIYTTAFAYQGGVLATNGDIYFVSWSAGIGQKISAAGVVSTYSLVYTTTNAYSGGVIAPNGDIHFVPRNANRGQKISAAGVVSTYSLVYTTTGAYSGGVLAPNGDIHFIPYEANRGQKISAAGVVSTYSLVQTRVSAYVGGVLTPNGDIYFIPAGETIGQKISTGTQRNIGYALSPFFNKF